MNTFFYNTKAMQQLLTTSFLYLRATVLTIFLLFVNSSLEAQVTFHVSNETGQQDDLVCVSVTVSNFEGVGGITLGLMWNSEELEGEQLILNPDISWLTETNYLLFPDRMGCSGAAEPIPNGGVALPDGTLLFQVCTRILNSCSYTAIEESETQFLLQVVDENGDPLPAQIIPGSVDNPRTDLIQSITPDTAICGGDNAPLQVIAPEAVSYAWSTNGNDALSCNDCPNPLIESPFNEAIYTVTVTDAAGCRQVDEVQVNVNQYLDFGLLPFSNSPICFGDTIAFDPNIFDGQYYEWSGPDGFYSNESHPLIPDANFDNDGDYTFSAIDNIGCEVSADFSVTVAPELLLFTDPTDATCLDSEDGQVIINIAGGVIPYNYDINFPGTGDDPDLFQLAPGHYTITITDAADCTVDGEFTIGVQSNPEWSVTLDKSDCTDAIDRLIFTGPDPSGYDYSLDGGLNFSPIPVSTVVLVDSSTVIDLMIRNPEGCIQSIDPTQFEVIEFQFLAETITPAYCNGSNDGSVTFEALNGIPTELEWVYNGFSPPNIDPDNLFPGYYEVTATSDNLCTATAIFDLDYTNEITFELDYSPTVPCPNDATTLTLVSASGGITSNLEDYWLSVDGAVVGNGNASVDLTPGVYAISVHDASCNAAILIEITSNSDLGILNVLAENLTCQGDPGSITVYPTGGTPPYLYTWWDNQTTTENSYPVASIGTYEVTLTDSEGCTIELDGIEVGQGLELTVDPDTVICQGDALTLNAVSSDLYNYEWSPATGLDNPFSSNPVAQPTETTTYTVTVTDVQSTGCTVIDSVTITVVDCSFAFSDTIYVGDTVTWCDPTQGPLGLEVTEIIAAPLGFILYDTDLGENCIDFIGQEAGADTMIVELCYGSTSPCVTLIVDILVEDTPVWPGDTDDNGVVDNFDALNIGLAINSGGPTRPNASLTWEAQPAPDWLFSTPDGSNYKHSDTDGNGLIDLNDTLAISLNWGEEHQFTNENPDENRLLGDVPFYLEPDTLIEGQTINLPIILGTDEMSAEDVYGLAFSLNYNPEIIAMNSAFVELGSSWLGTPDVDMFILQKDFHSMGRTDIGLSRIDGMNVSGSGAIGQFIVTIEDDILFWSNEEERNELVAEFSIDNVRLINFAGEEIPVDAQSTLTEIISDQNEVDLSRWIRLSPNPAREKVYIQSGNLKILKGQLFNALGRVVWQTDQWEHNELDVSHLPKGTYFLSLQTDRGIGHKKLIID